MKTALLSVSTEKQSLNIGDYIQALASAQFLGKDSIFIEREKIDEYDGEDVMMIMNGWFMFHPEHWPPSKKIHPLFVAFHLNNLADKQFLKEESISYLKQYEPIGCRDKKTVEKLRRQGVNAYFSGCMTLTLGLKYHSEQKNGKVFITDPPLNSTSKLEKIWYTLQFFNDFPEKYKIYKKWYGNEKFSLFKLFAVSKYYCIYSELFDKHLLLEAEYVQQEAPFYHNYPLPQDKLKKAEEIIEDYAKASCVITSRIHCALPCLGLGTPVIYIYNDMQDELSSCRMDGLLQLFNVVHLKKNKLVPFSIYDKNNKITKENFPKNKEDWKVYADGLIQRCREFLNNLAK